MHVYLISPAHKGRGFNHQINKSGRNSYLLLRWWLESKFIELPIFE